MKKLKHLYGEHVHILNSPITSGLLAQLCQAETTQPQINHLIGAMYKQLIQQIIDEQFATEKASAKTRMSEVHQEAVIHYDRINPNSKAVTVNLARAGTYPSHICYDLLHLFLKPENIRQDHIFAARITNAQNQVSHAAFGSMKVGGGIKDSYVMFPDPMGATGNTLLSALDFYKTQTEGPARKFIAIHLIVTPEYLKKLKDSHPDLVIYALRLDRGLSSKAILDSTPGEFWDQEKGLNQNQYIVPGAGGLGELMNNSYV